MSTNLHILLIDVNLKRGAGRESILILYLATPQTRINIYWL